MKAATPLDDPFSPERIARAQLIVQEIHAKCNREAGGDRTQRRRLLWNAARSNQTFQTALARLTVAVGELIIAHPDECRVEHGPAPLADVELTQADHSGGDQPIALLAAHDPLSSNKLSAAGEVFASAVMRAQERCNGEPEAARRLLWAWAKQDPELGIAILRLGASDKKPTVLVVVPAEAAEPEPPLH